MKAVTLNQSNFESEVLQAAQPVIVDFWAEWCGPCRMLAPVLDQLAAEFPERLKVAKVNVDENEELGQRYGIQSLPTLLYFVNGEVQAQTLGVVSRKTILATLEEVERKAAAR